VVDKGIKETDGILCSNVVVEPCREQDGFVAVRAVDTTHERTKLPKSNKVSRDSVQRYSLPKHCVFTQSRAVFGAARVRRHAPWVPWPRSRAPTGRPAA